jgi:HD-GYP domain-containing protein (c-di-GMP phosphodiesterase class II)
VSILKKPIRPSSDPKPDPTRVLMPSSAIFKKPVAGWEQVPEWAQLLARTLLAALKERDPYTYGHCRRVARHARLLAQAAGLSEYECQLVEFSSMFHDLGKMGIPDSILLKPGRLTPEEEAIMRAHPVKSAEIVTPLSHLPFFKAMLPGIRHHHERIDGLGYPHGRAGDRIPLEARIILIADTFDAMTTTRPYRKGLPHDFAYAELRKFGGRQFDAQLVEVFLKAHPGWGHLDEEITEEFVAAIAGKRAA